MRLGSVCLLEIFPSPLYLSWSDPFFVWFFFLPYFLIYSLLGGGFRLRAGEVGLFLGALLTLSVFAPDFAVPSLPVSPQIHDLVVPYLPALLLSVSF